MNSPSIWEPFTPHTKKFGQKFLILHRTIPICNKNWGLPLKILKFPPTLRGEEWRGGWLWYDWMERFSDARHFFKIFDRFGTSLTLIRYKKTNKSIFTYSLGKIEWFNLTYFSLEMKIIEYFLTRRECETLACTCEGVLISFHVRIVFFLMRGERETPARRWLDVRYKTEAISSQK